MIKLLCIEEPIKKYPKFNQGVKYRVENPDGLKEKKGIIKIQMGTGKYTIQRFEFVDKLLTLNYVGGKFKIITDGKIEI